MKRVPIIATIVVLAAVATMVGLGIWQIGRAHEKEALLARYEAAAGLPPIDFPVRAMAREDMPLFRQEPGNLPRAGRREDGGGPQSRGPLGLCPLGRLPTTGAEGPGLQVDIGWSEPAAADRAGAAGRCAGSSRPIPSGACG